MFLEANVHDETRQLTIVGVFLGLWAGTMELFAVKAGFLRLKGRRPSLSLKVGVFSLSAALYAWAYVSLGGMRTLNVFCALVLFQLLSIRLVKKITVARARNSVSGG